MSYVVMSLGSDVDRPLQRWEHAVHHANEACLVLATNFTIIAASAACAELFSVPVAATVGCPLVEVIDLLDFNAVPGKLPVSEVDKIPPRLAIVQNSLARGLLRVGEPDSYSTFDAISVPLLANSVVAGSLTFFSTVGRAPVR